MPAKKLTQEHRNAIAAGMRRYHKRCREACGRDLDDPSVLPKKRKKRRPAKRSNFRRPTVQKKTRKLPVKQKRRAVLTQVARPAAGSIAQPRVLSAGQRSEYRAMDLLSARARGYDEAGHDHGYAAW